MEPQETPPVEVPAPPPATPVPPPSVFSSPLLWMSIAIIILMMIGIAFYYFVSSRQHMTLIIVRPSSPAPSTSSEQATPTSEPTQTAQASPSATTSDLPPLFPGVEWEATTSGKITVYRTEPYGPTNIDGYRIQTIKLQTYPTDMINYYKKQLELKNWNLIAETDNTSFYGKGNRYFTIGINQIKLPEEQYQGYVEFN